ncbi:MAG: DUF4105 domain-containing protein [Spirochaetales bacterium]
MKKHFFLFALVFLLALPRAFSLSLTAESESHPFDSLPMLESFYDESDDGFLSFWDSCSVSLLTVGPGGPLYSWFGHSALLVTTPSGSNITFDYGSFSFNADSFFLNFAMGRLWFVCSASYAEAQLDKIKEEGRSVTRIELPLDAVQKKAVIEFLNSNAKTENSTYLYHHYRDNCATRLRDIIDRSANGAFKEWAQKQSGLSYRKQASRALSRNPFVQWALDFLQSGQIDKDATLWEEMFLPDVLEKAVKEYFSLESTEIAASSGRYSKSPSEPQSNILFSILAGVLLGGVSASLILFGRENINFIYIGIVETIFAVMGLLLLFMMLFTNHDVTWYNENIIFVNPLLLVPAVSAFRKSSRTLKLCHRILLAVIAVLVLLKILIPYIFIQNNWTVIITMVLFYLPNGLYISRKK